MSALSFLNPGGDKDPDHAGAARALAGAPGMANAALQFAMSAPPRPERWEDVSMGGAPAGGTGAAGQQPELIVQDWIHNLIPQQGGTRQQGGSFRSGAGQSPVAAVSPSSFDERLAHSESRGRYNLVNGEGYSGKYQMGEAALAAAGVYRDDNLNDNKWNGQFVGLPGVQTHADFVASPEAQEAAYQRHKAHLSSEAERRGLDKFIGQAVNGVPVTRDGILAAMHLAGPGGATRFLNSGGQYNPADSNGTTPLDYMARHASGDGGRVQVADAGGFTVPASTARAVNGGQSGADWQPPFRVQRNQRTGEARYIDAATGTVFKPSDSQMEYIQAVSSGTFRGSPLDYARAKAEATRDDTTPAIREWQTAVRQGFRGSLIDYQAQVAAATRDNTTGDMKEWLDAVERKQFQGSLLAFQRAKAEGSRDLPVSVREANFARENPWYDEREIALRQASRPQTTVDMRQENEEAKAEGRRVVEEFQSIQQRGQMAADAINQINIGRSIPEVDANGELLPSAARQKIGNAMVALGFSPESPMMELLVSRVSDGQSFTAVMQNLVLTKMQAQKGPQTENDAKRIESTVASLGNTPDARDFILRAAVSLAQRDVDQQQFYETWRQAKGTYAGASSAWRERQATTPIAGTDSDTGKTVFFNEFRDAYQSARPDGSDDDMLKVWKDRYVKRQQQGMTPEQSGAMEELRRRGLLQ